MTRQFRLLAALILVTAIGMMWPAETAAPAPAPGGRRRRAHRACGPEDVSLGWWVSLVKTTPPGRTIAPTTTGRITTRVTPYTVSYTTRRTTRPISASALELDSGLAGDRSAQRTGMGIPIHIPTAMRRRTRMPSPMRVMGPATPGRTPCRCNSRQPASVISGAAGRTPVFDGGKRVVRHAVAARHAC